MKFAVAVMLTGSIFMLRMTICLVTKLFHRNKDLDSFFFSSIELNSLLLFFVLPLSFFWYVLKMFLAVWLC